MPTETLSPRRQSFVTHFVLNGNRTEAAREAGYKHPKMAGSRLMTYDDVTTAIASKQAMLAVQSDYTTALWQQDLRRRIDLAEQSSSWSAVFKGMELLGRNIGALTDSGRLSADEANLFAWLGAAAERAGWGLGSPRVDTPTSSGVRELEDGGARESAGGSARAREAGEGGGTRLPSKDSARDGV